ncbi:hypothetical protein DGM85_08000 [Xanthomonas phaseoli pv. phaseoli]|nr:hypothetical protein DGM93_07770 [Xanthomonas phaseoli pv. phaseoli]QWN28470.1 hypothetical protein DGM85_08000 [Xanthomonas phaseoli pv. phaseoli]QWN32616.1 hypothetical protein DGM81_07790 [Xanthomonas phaseoli pv. phaseoli]
MSRLRDLQVACRVSAVCPADGCLDAPASVSACAVRLLGRVQRVRRAGPARLAVAGRQER